MAAQWLKGYLQASFRGVPFFIRSSNRSGGRRDAEHLFPDKDDPLYEDLGKKPRVYRLSGYVVDDNYYGMRNDLIEALEAFGPGKLVHPYFGTFQAKCSDWDEVETTEEGRMARFNMTFKKDVGPELTTVTPNAQSLAFAAKTSLLDAILGWFEDAYDIASAPVRAIEDLTDTIDEGLQVVDSAKKLANTQAEFKRALQNLEGKAISLALNARVLASSFSDIINFGTNVGSSLQFNATADNAKQQTQEQYELADSADTPFVDTPTSISQDDDYPAFQVQQIIKYNAVAALVGLTTVEPFASTQDAEAAKTKLFDLIDEVSATSFVTDEIYEALRDAKAAVNEDLNQRSITLPRIVSVELPETRNVLLVSNEIFGNLDEEEDIITRNKVIHPGFVGGAEPIDVRVDNA
jgi:prophage DNA circulation protein